MKVIEVRNTSFLWGITIAVLAAAVGGVTVAATARHHDGLQMGKQPDGGFVVSSGQRIPAGTIAFDGRATDLALHPSGKFVAVVAASRVFLARASGIIEGSEAKLPGSAAFHGIVWSPDGAKLYVSVSKGMVQELTLDGEKLTLARALMPRLEKEKGNPNPGGMAITRDGKTLYVADCDQNAVAEIDLTTGMFTREFPTQNLPFEVKLSADERTLIATDWGGALPQHARADGDDEGNGKFGIQSGGALVVAIRNGAAATGTLELIDRATGATRHVPVGLHPTDIAVSTQGKLAYVANAASDTISVVDLAGGKVARTISLLPSSKTLWGKMPCALALSPDGKTLFVCDGGDNALAEVDIAKGQVRGLWPAGYFPIDVALSTDGRTAFVVNTKGNGSVRRTAHGKPAPAGTTIEDPATHVRSDAPTVPVPGNVHDFEGTVSVIDLAGDLDAATRQVSLNNGWDRPGDALHPPLAVYKGAIEHVLYIIKENRSYDEVFGDMPEGNGDPKLCDMGEKFTPNAHALARTFTLFDNGYVSGTNSADGHCWTDQAVANDYLEHLYTDYRTYPDGEDDAMAIDPTGCLWDAALKKGKTVRVYGEASDYNKPDDYYITPPVKSWLDLYHDRLLAHHTIHNITRLPSLKPLKNTNYLYWPLLQPDQSRADIFIAEYNGYSQQNKVPNLMVLSLPCDHTEGSGKKYPKPKSMVADNDLALGRIVEAVSHSPQWKSTCILVIEDDAQAGLDHVDGHRTVFAAYSPYIRRRFVDSNFYSTVSMLHTIELMLGIDPMNRFDATAPPLSACFTDKPEPAPYTSLPANIALDDMNAPQTALKGKARYWSAKSDALDWSGMDRADAVTLSQILWHDARGLTAPYPHGDPAGYAGNANPGLTAKDAASIRKEDDDDNPR